MKQVTCKRTNTKRFLNRECLLTCPLINECDHEALANKNIWIDHT